ncbi:MAG: transposase, partial [Lutibacter sp.]
KARAEYLAERADKKVILFDMMVDMAEKEYNIDVRKNYKPELLTASKKHTKKQ